MKQVFPMDSRVTYDAEGRPSYDRAVSSKPLRSLIRKLFTTGVMPNPSDTCQVRAGGDGMTLIVSPGLAVLEGGLYLEDAARTLSVTAADPTFDRIDTVVLRWNENDAVRDCDLHVVAGVPAKNPVRPALTREGSIYEIGLADIFVTKGVATITNEKITDTRMESARCGIVSSVSEFDTTTIYQQIQGELAKFKSDEEVAFSEWFDYMKDQLTEDAAGKLQEEVDDVRGQIHTNLLNPTLETTTINGVTCTNNGDGTYTLNGKATSAWSNLPIETNLTLETDKTYKICGGENQQSDTTYLIELVSIRISDGYRAVVTNEKQKNTFVALSGYKYEYRIHVFENATITNALIKPMITTDLSADYDSFVKYSGSEERLNEQVASLHESSKGVITNLLNPTLGTATVSGITCTANGDGTYKLNGKSTTQPGFILCSVSGLSGKHKLVGCPSGGGQYTFNISYRVDDVWSSKYETGNGLVIDCDPAKTYQFEFVIRANQTLNNVTFKPMLTTDLDATYNDYVPYSGDGRLNENVAALFDMFHPIGSLFPTTNASFDPNTAKGWHGTWERITDCVIYAASDNVTGGIGAIVGSNTHTLTEAELPSHRHTTPQLTATGGNHSHNIGVDNNYQTALGLSDTTPATSHWAVVKNGGYSGNGKTLNAISSGNLSMTVPASNTGYTGSGTAIDIRPRRLNSVVWRRTA